MREIEHIDHKLLESKLFKENDNLTLILKNCILELEYKNDEEMIDAKFIELENKITALELENEQKDIKIEALELKCDTLQAQIDNLIDPPE